MSKKMFDFVIGNPPYQEDMKDTSDAPVYNLFMDAAYNVAEKVELITPARFLFNAGKTPKVWNRKMLSDPHVKVLRYEQNSSRLFPNTDIKGGVAVTYRDENKEFGAIGVFTSYDELCTIQAKVSSHFAFNSLSGWIYAPESYKFSETLWLEHPELKSRLSKGHDYDIVTNIFSKLPEIFYDRPLSQGDYLGVVGLIKNKRHTKWIKRKYIKPHPNLMSYKIVLPKSNGTGAIGEVLSTPLIGEPLIGEPLIGHTQSFISIGALSSVEEAEALLKYIKTKFARTLLGILKITQDNKKSTWQHVPLQDFTTSSDIDWSQSIADIDQQLYRKYDLDEHEINFIETHVKEME